MDNINKQFYNYLWAYVLVALSGCLGNVVDGIIVGNLISADGVSAISLSKPVNQFIFTLHLLINAGAGMLVGYALGQKNINDARRFFSISLSLSVGLGVLLALFCGVFFLDETTRLLCNNEQILPLARDYMQVLLLGNPAFILMWGLSTMVSFPCRYHIQCVESFFRHCFYPMARLGNHRLICGYCGWSSCGHCYFIESLVEARAS